MRRYTVEELGLADSEPEPAFTHLTELASRLIDAPVSLLTVVRGESERHCAEAGVGTDVERTALSRSFCRQVVSTGESLVIDDSLEHLGVGASLIVEEFGVRAYLGMPVLDPCGKPVASLCVIDSLPRRWSAEERATLEKLSQCATDAVRLVFEVRQGEALRRKQQDFAHAMSHDLKGPLHTLSWVIEDVVDHHAGDFSDDTRQLVEAARATLSRSRRMVDDLLEYSLVDAHHELALAPVDLSELVGEIKESLSADIACHDARVQIRPPLPIVAGNRVQLNMLFQNLIGNALKFHRPGKPPRVRVSGREFEESVEVTVTDNGIGISEEHRQRVFGLFERLRRDDAHEGSGIGLTLVTRVLENHGGSVRIESDGATGSAFTVRLPRRDLLSIGPDSTAIDAETDELALARAA